VSLRSVARFFLIILALASLLAGVAQAGTDTWTSNGPFGGWIEALAIDPLTPSTLYAGTSGGGVFDITQVEFSDGFESGDTSASSNSVP
jgi:disulfide bond formation protein DsbB